MNNSLNKTTPTWKTSLLKGSFTSICLSYSGAMYFEVPLWYVIIKRSFFESFAFSDKSLDTPKSVNLNSNGTLPHSGLNMLSLFSDTSILASLMSRWRIFYWCRFFNVVKICRITTKAHASLYCLVNMHKECSEPWGQYSRTRWSSHF